MNTAVYNIRIDIRSIATLHKHYTKQGMSFKSVSTLNRHTLESLAELLIQQKGAERFIHTVDARNYLESVGLLKTIKVHQTKSLTKAMQDESLDLDGLNPDSYKPKFSHNISEDQYEAAKKILEQKEAEDLSGAILGANPGEIKK